MILIYFYLQSGLLDLDRISTHANLLAPFGGGTRWLPTHMIQKEKNKPSENASQKPQSFKYSKIQRVLEKNHALSGVQLKSVGFSLKNRKRVFHLHKKLPEPGNRTCGSQTERQTESWGPRPRPSPRVDFIHEAQLHS